MSVNPSKSTSVVAGVSEFDMVLVGGGLQNCLIAKSVLAAFPAARVLLLESAEQLAGNHTWCFHAQDFPSNVARSCRSFVAHRWSEYEVRFPGHLRTLPSTYSMMTSDRVREVTAAAIDASPNARLLTGTRAVSVKPGEVTTDAGARFTAPIVVDSRGPGSLLNGSGTQAGSAFQKFLGLELELAEDGPGSTPTLMDARVRQQDGFRFVYSLPISPRRVLVEDTYYSKSPRLDETELRQGMLEYARQRGWRPRRVVRMEKGVLPLPLGGMPRGGVSEGPLGILVNGGYGGGWFHPTTGYSGAAASRLAAYFMENSPGDASAAAIERVHVHVLRQARFGIWLNRLMFHAFEQNNRYSPLERFYKLPTELIERFYALKLSPADQLRVVCGKPPKGFSITRLIRSANGSTKSGVLHDPTST